MLLGAQCNRHVDLKGTLYSHPPDRDFGSQNLLSCRIGQRKSEFPAQLFMNSFIMCAMQRPRGVLGGLKGASIDGFQPHEDGFGLS
jgi:hypothetical protein